MFLSACTTLQPLPPPSRDLFFPTEAADGAPDRCKTSPGSLRDCVKPAVDPEGYAGGLGRAIWQTELDRYEYAQRGTEKTNLGSAFNALLWPVGAYVAARNLAHPSASLVRDAGAFSLAAYGVLSSGVPERDKLYLEASRRLACAIALGSSRLYAKADFDALELDTFDLRTLPPDERALSEVKEALTEKLKDFKAEWRTTLGKLQSRPAGTRDVLAVEKRLNEVLGKGSAPARGDTVAAFSAASRDQSAAASALLLQLSDVPGQTQRAARELRDRRDDVKRKLDQALIAKAPALTAPDAGFAQALALLNKTAQALAASAAASAASAASKGKAQGGAVPWQVDEKTLAGLKETSRGELRKFDRNYAIPLIAAMEDADAWLKLHRKRVDDTRQQAATWGCTDAMFEGAAALALASGAPAPEQAASR